MGKGTKGASVALAGMLSLLCSPAAAEDERPSEYRVWAGLQHPAELMTANVLTGGRLALRGVEAVTAPLERDVSPTAAVMVRAGGFLLVDLPVLSYTLVVPHELFGHAARHREFDSKPEIHFDLPLPYGWHADHYVTHRQTRLLYGGEQSVALLGGLEAQEASQRALVWTVFRTGPLR
ncbi:MAG: hypothetical protein K0S65_1694, partial [Labilithrix sp.]|nr:hypothetical protein [Labilithrix sp.]